MEKSNKNLKFNVMAVLLIIILCFAVSPKTLQNDTYYTIKIGEYILENGITMQDPFSWQDLAYTFPHWAYDVLIYLIYSLAGHLGIYISTIVLSSVLGLVIYFTNCKMLKNRVFSFVLTIAAMFLLKGYIAARAQLFTFILFALELYCIEGLLETAKKRYIIGLLIIPVLLANFHSAVFPFYFVIYLPYIGEYVVSLISKWFKNFPTYKIKKLNKKLEKLKDENIIIKTREQIAKLIEKEAKQSKIAKKEPYKIVIKENKNIKLLIIVMILCIFAGLFTPLKDVPYTYLYNTMRGNSTQNISEHLPLTLINNLKYMCALVFFLSILIFTDTKIRLSDLFMLGGLIFLTFSSRRQESMFIIMCIPIFNRLITSFVNKYDKNGIEQFETAMTKVFGIIITTLIVVWISIALYGKKYKNSYVSESTYPVKASEWIINNLNLDEIKLYNEYNYGSYLLFKGIPVYLDSRCDLYMPEFNKKGVDSFNDFLKIANLNIKNLEEEFNRIGFTHFIMYKGSRLTIYLDIKDDIYNKIYSDDYFTIYERNV